MQVAAFPPEPALEAAYEEVSESAYLDEEDGQRATAARALARIERHSSDGRGVLLDLGCWVGFLLSEAERRGWEAWGVEPSAFAAEFARDRMGLRVVQATLEGADLPESHFDAVVLGDVIEHLPDPGAALRRITRLLAPQGVLYLALPDAGSVAAQLLGSRWWSVIPTHVQYFTRASIARLLARHSYVVEWMGSAPKAFTVRYYLERLEGYTKPLAGAAVATAERAGLAERIVWPNLRDRMAVVARRPGV
jgi:SAM-dependent methyltransferase